MFIAIDIINPHRPILNMDNVYVRIVLNKVDKNVIFMTFLLFPIASNAFVRGD